MCNSICSPILLRPSPQEIVLGRLRGRIRRLFDVGASIRVENDGDAGDAGNRWGNGGFDQCATYNQSILPAIPIPNTVSYHYITNYIPQSLPVEGGSHREPLANDLLRERIAHIGEQTDLHKLHPSNPIHKSFAELFQKRPFPPRPLVLLPIAQQLRYFAKVKPYFSARAAKVPSAIRSFMDLLNSGQRSEFWRKATPYSSLVSSAATTRSA